MIKTETSRYREKSKFPSQPFSLLYIRWVRQEWKQIEPMIIAILLNTEDNSKNITFRKQKPANFHAFFLKKKDIFLCWLL
jgi:hypothetical protein